MTTRAFRIDHIIANDLIDEKNGDFNLMDYRVDSFEKLKPDRKEKSAFFKSHKMEYFQLDRHYFFNHQTNTLRNDR